MLIKVRMGALRVQRPTGENDNATLRKQLFSKILSLFYMLKRSLSDSAEGESPHAVQQQRQRAEQDREGLRHRLQDRHKRILLHVYLSGSQVLNSVINNLCVCAFCAFLLLSFCML